MAVYFGFAISASMFPVDGVAIIPSKVEPVSQKGVIEAATPCLNPSHAATIDAMQARFDLSVAIPEKAPMVSLNAGDSVIVMQVRGLPRLEGRHEYTAEEIEGASFDFRRFDVVAH